MNKQTLIRTGLLYCLQAQKIGGSLLPLVKFFSGDLLVASFFIDYPNEFNVTSMSTLLTKSRYCHFGYITDNYKNLKITKVSVVNLEDNKVTNFKRYRDGDEVADLIRYSREEKFDEYQVFESQAAKFLKSGRVDTVITEKTTTIAVEGHPEIIDTTQERHANLNVDFVGPDDSISSDISSVKEINDLTLLGLSLSYDGKILRVSDNAQVSKLYLVLAFYKIIFELDQCKEKPVFGSLIELFSRVLESFKSSTSSEFTYDYTELLSPVGYCSFHVHLNFTVLPSQEAKYPLLRARECDFSNKFGSFVDVAEALKITREECWANAKYSGGVFRYTDLEKAQIYGSFLTLGGYYFKNYDHFEFCNLYLNVKDSLSGDITLFILFSIVQFLKDVHGYLVDNVTVEKADDGSYILTCFNQDVKIDISPKALGKFEKEYAYHSAWVPGAIITKNKHIFEIKDGSYIPRPFIWVDKFSKEIKASSVEVNQVEAPLSTAEFVKAGQEKPDGKKEESTAVAATWFDYSQYMN